MTQSLTAERDLTEDEIKGRTKLRDELDDEHDDLIKAVEDRRREIRGFNAKKKKIESQLRDVRRELRTGKMFESPQGTLGFDMTVPDPFSAQYPIAVEHERLHIQLSVVLQGVLVPSIEKLEKWHESEPAFQEIAHWARTELAYMNQKSHPDLELPPRLPMPERLSELRMYLGKASQRRPRAVKVRPVGGTPARTGQGSKPRKPAARARGRK